ncbi:LacI family DNA-binding transcriptional regulator [Rhizobium ruizarguesonis]|jgi:LacI family transcriptional regulator|uniref:LacI family DNA-binding transcriptional regulator n=1 Tax=Rhizobium ruizarguesonis TaxID=2081791 RepID=UPI00102FC913|nr:LacI family DNA-binding transcriptional regulator [Rhizobium ruizarguesonis]TAZ70571.1 LacI family transcriptional regulator [Rhizobium ruizarguesonis]
MNEAVTIKDVANELGVHPSTVSRALDPAKRGLVGKDVVQRVIETAQRLGYTPDAAAATLRRGRSKLIGVIVPDIANPVFSPIIGGLENALAEVGYALIVADQPADAKSRLDIIETLVARRVDGLVLATAALIDDAVERCIRRGVPVVLVNRAEESDRAPSVVSDDVEGMKLAVEHLISLGHQRIIHLAGPKALSTGSLRRKGFKSAMKAAGLSLSRHAIVESTAFTRAAGALAAAELLKRNPDATAIVAANDLLALGAYEALTSVGRRCPEDVSVVGHNDMPLVDMVSPALTSIRISHREMGDAAGRLLVALINGQETSGSRIVMRPTLIVRQSTAKAST